MTPVQVDALDAARRLAEAGVPLFLGRPANNKLGFQLPKGWERRAKADPEIVDRWKPGWALCAVTGHLVDVIDIDPRNGGSLEALEKALGDDMPRVYGMASTPSGGKHLLVASLGVRKVQNIVPGVDLQAGNPEGVGRGFVFIAPTVRESKTDGSERAYTWQLDPELGPLLLEADDTGAALRELATERGPGERTGGVEYTGPAYDELDEEKQKAASAHVNEQLEHWAEIFADAVDWPEDYRDEKGRGWEALNYQFAWALAKMAACPWNDFSEGDAEASYHGILPDDIAAAFDVSKWDDGIVGRAATEPVSVPPWELWAGPEEDFADQPDAWPAIPTDFDDAYMCAWMAHRGLRGDWVWSGELGWLHWNGERWRARSEEVVIEAVRQQVQDLVVRVAAGGNTDALKAASRLRTRSRLTAITALMRGVTHVPGDRFDTRADYLTCANGSVNLQTGELEPHSRDHYSTKSTGVDYVPGAHHRDWNQVLTALEPEVMDWMQVRLGQAATGYLTSDDVMPICSGGGSNGKSTLFGGVQTALGEYATLVPHTMLNDQKHDSDTMLLRGSRMALMEETPEEGRLDALHVKEVLGAPRMQGRELYKKRTTWDSTHSLFITTNFVPQVSSQDHGTWRRLALVKFDKRFPRRDGFREAVVSGRDGRAEAALAWIVEGARKWYAAGKRMPDAPPKVRRDTDEWRGSVDLLAGFMFEGHVQLDPTGAVETTELLLVFNDWLVENGHRGWSSKLLAQRIAEHRDYKNVEKGQLPQDEVDWHPVGVMGRKSPRAAHPAVYLGLSWPETSEFE